MWVCICAHSFQAWNHVSCFVKVLMCTDDIGNGSFSFNLLGLFEKIITSPMRDIQNAWYTLNVSYGTIKRQDVLPTFQVPYTNMYINLKKNASFLKRFNFLGCFLLPPPSHHLVDRLRDLTRVVRRSFTNPMPSRDDSCRCPAIPTCQRREDASGSQWKA